MWLLLVLFLAGTALGILLLYVVPKRKTPGETYVCDLCGEKHCICHKKE